MFGELSDEDSTGEVVPLYAIQDRGGNNLAITAANVPPLEAFPVTVLPNLIRQTPACFGVFSDSGQFGASILCKVGDRSCEQEVTCNGLPLTRDKVTLDCLGFLWA